MFAPERHDLVLSKLVRGVQSDLEHVAAIHRREALDLEVLVERFRVEMAHAIGHPATLRANFLLCVAELFGELAGDEIAERLGPKLKK